VFSFFFFLPQYSGWDLNKVKVKSTTSFFFVEFYMDIECIESCNITNLEDGITNHMSNGLETPSKVISSHETNDGDHPNLHPRIGTEFNTIKDVKEFCISFAKKEGFGIRTRTTKEIFCTLVCSNEGKHTTKSSKQ